MATNINTILNWFKTGFKPTQAQFWATWTSFWHKDEQIPQNSISGLENTLNTKAEKAQLDAHLSDKNAHADLFDKKANSIHNHIIDDIEGLENVLNDKALLSHEHEIADIKGLEDQLVAKLTATLATDAETQIDTNVSEDNKVISRSKLLSWWQWIKSKTQTISGSWNFTNGLKAEVSVDLKEPTSQKGISMVKDGLKFWFTEVINSLLKTNPSSTGISMVLMPEMQNGETKTLATLDDLNSSSQDLQQTLDNGSEAFGEIKMKNGTDFQTTVNGLGINVNYPNGGDYIITSLSMGNVRVDDINGPNRTDLDSDELKFYKDYNTVSLKGPDVSTGTFTQTLQDKSGVVALLSDITGGSQTLNETLANGNESDKDIVINSVAKITIGGKGIDVASTYNSSFYSNIRDQHILVHSPIGQTNLLPEGLRHFNQYGSGNTTLVFDHPTSEDFTQTFQAKDGIVALLSDITGGSQTLDETLQNGNLSDRRIVLTSTSQQGVKQSASLGYEDINIRTNLGAREEIVVIRPDNIHYGINDRDTGTVSSTYLKFDIDGNYGNFTQNFQAKSGTIALLSDVLATRDEIPKTVENFTPIDLTTADLNTAYPNAVLGFKVNASSIIGGGFIYEKTSTGWVQYTVTKVL
jgi:hypothetical protein